MLLIELANATAYSLTSSLWIEGMRLAMELSGQIHADKVIVNESTYMMETWHHQAGMGYVYRCFSMAMNSS